MLRFVLGPAGSGKTALLAEEIRRGAELGRSAILLVPEQYSFESEKRLYRLLGPKNSLRAEVLSFTRLCERIFRRFGGLAGAQVTAPARVLLMSVAVQELQDKLVVYRKNAGNPGFLQTLLAACSEFKTAGVTPPALREFALRQEPGALRDKLEDLSLVYLAYQKLLEAGYSDPEDSLARACAVLERENFFGGLDVYVDGFTTFMAAEFELLGHILSQADSAVFALTCDGAVDPQNGAGVLSPPRQAAARLQRMAAERGAETAEPVILPEPLRAARPELAHLSVHFPHPSSPVFEGEAGAIRLFAAPDVYAEAEMIAVSIASLVRERGYAYSDIAVAARSPAPFLHALEMMFERYEIPFFADRNRDAEASPLAAGLLCALDAIRYNFDAASMLMLARSPIMGLDPLDAARLDNYCYVWSIRGRLWQSPFAGNPRGLSTGFSDADAAELSRLNALREQLVSPLLRLREAVRRENGRDFARGIYDFLQEINAADNLSAYAEGLPAPQNDIFLGESVRLWDALMELVDVFGSVMGGAKTPWRRLCELLRLALSSCETGSLPQTLDQVLVGGADRIRPEKLRAVFVMGANEGVFPASSNSGGVFSDEDRRRMIGAGLEVTSPGVAKAALEQFYVYFACTLPSELLTVSWQTGEGGQSPESAFVARLRDMFPKHEELKLSPLDYVAGGQTAFAALAGHYRQDTAFTSSLLEALAEAHGDGIARMERLSRKEAHRLADISAAQALFGRRMHLSPSRVERFHRCPYAYFIQDGLSVRARRKAEFSPLESGGVIHHVLHIMMQKYGGRGLAAQEEAALSKEISGIIAEYLAERAGDVSALPARMRYLFDRLCGMLARLLLHLGREFSQSLFEPVAYELPISREEGVKPLLLQTPGGALVSVEGVVDRVDILQKGNERYLRVVDYKSGKRSFKLADVLYGLNLQMLVYLFTIGQNGEGALENAIPAGVLYMPVREGYVGLERGDEEKAAAEHRVRLRMDGLLLDEPEILEAMEQELRGVFLPVRLNKSGAPDPKSALASREEMGRLAGKIGRIIADMADGLRAGKIPACPVSGQDYDVCASCDFAAVCGFEPGDPVRTLAQMDRDEFFRELEQELTEGAVF